MPTQTGESRPIRPMPISLDSSRPPPACLRPSHADTAQTRHARSYDTPTSDGLFSGSKSAPRASSRFRVSSLLLTTNRFLDGSRKSGAMALGLARRDWLTDRPNSSQHLPGRGRFERRQVLHPNDPNSSAGQRSYGPDCPLAESLVANGLPARLRSRSLNPRLRRGVYRDRRP